MGVQNRLREPILKIMHVLRVLGYQALFDELVLFGGIQEVIGQFPFESPKFFQSDCEPPSPNPSLRMGAPAVTVQKAACGAV